MQHPDSPIRKLTTGNNYNDSMNYIVGQVVIGKKATIKYIFPNEGGYDIMVENDQNEVYKWKHINSKVPATVEFNTDL